MFLARFCAFGKGVRQVLYIFDVDVFGRGVAAGGPVAVVLSTRRFNRRRVNAVCFGGY